MQSKPALSPKPQIRCLTFSPTCRKRTQQWHAGSCAPCLQNFLEADVPSPAIAHFSLVSRVAYPTPSTPRQAAILRSSSISKPVMRLGYSLCQKSVVWDARVPRHFGGLHQRSRRSKQPCHHLISRHQPQGVAPYPSDGFRNHVPLESRPNSCSLTAAAFLTSGTSASLLFLRLAHATKRFRAKPPESQKVRMRSDYIGPTISKSLPAQSMEDRTSTDNPVCRGSKTPDRVDESAIHQSSHRMRHRSCSPIVAGNVLRGYEHISRRSASKPRRLP